MTTSLFNTGIRPAVDNWLLAKSKEVRDYGNYWSASSAGYCQRKLIFERLGVPYVVKEDDARKQRVFTAGNLFHAWMQTITKEAGLSIAQELELQDEELMVRGHIDDLVLIKPSKEEIKDMRLYEALNRTTEEEDRQARKDMQHLILYDYKTVNSRAFGYKDSMSHYWKMQLGTYMYMLRKLKEVPVADEMAPVMKAKNLMTGKTDYQFTPQDLTEARILLISKDDLRMKEQELLWSPELEKEVVDYWTSLNKHWAAHTLPPCTCADHENGFMAKERWNPYWFDGKPCSIELYRQWKKEQHATV